MTSMVNVERQKQLRPGWGRPEHQVHGEDTSDAPTVTGFMHQDGLAPEPERPVTDMGDDAFVQHIADKLEEVDLAEEARRRRDSAV